MIRYISLLLFIGLSFGQECTAADGTDGVELWGTCYSIDNTTELYLFSNQLTGAIPAEIGNLINLSNLYLNNNQLTGAIPPEIGNLTNLTHLYLNYNQLTGSIPLEIGNLTNLTNLYLNNNQFTSSISSEIGNLTNLTHLFLSSNQLIGSIPPEIGNLTNLNGLYLGWNQLTGEIPESICDLNINWNNSNTFNISNNQLCPPYPSCIEDYVGEQDTTNCNELVEWNFSISEPLIEVAGVDGQWNPGDTISIAMDFCNNTDVAHNYYPGITIESDSSLTSLHIGHIWFYAMVADECHAISWVAIANTSIISDTVVTFSAYPEVLTCENQPEYCIDGDTLTFEVPIIVQVVSTEPEYFIPEAFALHQNYPNPFNPITSLRYDLPEDGLVNITIYDMMGRLVKTLVNTSQTAGYKSIQWNATNDRNEPVSAGLYLFTIQSGEFRQSKKMVLLK